MNRLSVFLLICLAMLSTPRGEAAKYDWKVYASYHNATKSVEMGGRMYVVANGDLYSYGTDDQSVETYDKAGTLNDFAIYDIVASSGTGEVVVIYDNGNIDLMSTSGDVYNVSDLKSKALRDKTLNDVMIDGSLLYTSTNSGLAILDLGRKVFKNIYDWGCAVKSTTINDGYIVSATDKGVYRGNMSENLLDPANWQQISTNTTFKKFLKAGSTLYGVAGTLQKITDVATFTFTQVSADNIAKSWTCAGKVFYTIADNTLKSVDEGGTIDTYTSPYPISHLAQRGGTYWAACGENGFIGMSLSGQTFSQNTGDVTPNSPVRNYSYRMQMVGNRLLVAGGNFTYPSNDRTGTVMKYENGKWQEFQENFMEDKRLYVNTTDVVQDPNDSEHHWVGTRTSGIYEFKDYKFVRNLNSDNSALESILPNSSSYKRYVWVTALAYDNGGNLWMCNNQCESIVRILKPDGKWLNYYYDVIHYFQTFDYVRFDRRGWAWINSRRTTNVSDISGVASMGGVLIVNTNGTIDTQKDDTYKFYHTLVNQDNLSYDIGEFYCMQEDMDGAVWVGTTSGLFVANNPENIFSSDYRFTQIKVARDDGTGLADYLLNGVWVTCIAVDGANRKWIGTAGSGVLLISADGQQELQHFQKDNSPLLSDVINDIKINGETGEVFFATDLGLCSFTSDAVDAEETLDKNNIKVFPNPVNPESRQMVRVTGLAWNTDVKIANAAGRLVYEGTSNGGEFTWNCKTTSGKRVATGVYYILATDSDGKKGAYAKVLVVR